MKRYTCSGFRSVCAESADEAALIFAARQAVKFYGRGAYCRTLRLDSWSEDWACQTFEAFVGYAGQEPGTTVGRDTWITITRQEGE
jgi:hypothetical protein